MIYALLCNGASVVPLFVPLVLQVLLILLAIKYGRGERPKDETATMIVVSVALLVLATIAGLKSDLDNVLKLYKLLGNSIVAIFVVRGLSNRYGREFPAAYANAVLWMSVVGVAGLGLAAVTDWHITANIGDRAYHTNLLTAWISDSDFESSLAVFSPLPYRLQSFFDEPGTFGMLLVPAFFHFLDTGHRGKTAVLAACILLSESASAWFFAALLTALTFRSIRRRTDKFALLALLLAVGIYIAPDVVKLYEIKVGLDEAYANNSSFGTRSLEYDYVLRNLTTHFLPLSRMDQAYAELEGISSSYIAWYVLGGALFVLVGIGALFAIARVAIAAYRSKDATQRFATVLAVVLFSSGFQRTSFLDNILFMSLFYWALCQSPAPSVRKAAAA